MQWWVRAALVAALSCVSASAWSQALPKIEEFYFDEDAAVRRADDVVPGSGAAAIDELLKLRERGGRNAERVEVQLASILMAGGRVEDGKAMYQQVLAGLDSSSSMQRGVMWRYGWSLFRAGDAEAALTQWSRLVNESRGAHPAWAPTTLALALWKLERRDEAVRWYAAAVRTWPDRWSGTSQYATLLPDWQDSEREALADVQAAWAKERPAWP